MKALRSLLVVGLGLLLSAWTAEALQATKVARIGTLSRASGPNPNTDVF